MKHKHAEILHALADGEQIQFYEDANWFDLFPEPGLHNQCVIYCLLAEIGELTLRIKPKEKKKVEMWLWFYKSTNPVNIYHTAGFYETKELAELNEFDSGSIVIILGKVEGSRIEVEVDE